MSQKPTDIENDDNEYSIADAENSPLSENDNNGEFEAVVDLASIMEKHARVQADFENIKKRMERDKILALDYANEKFAKDLIPVLDSLSMAVNASGLDADPALLLQKLKEGIDLTMKQMLTVLEKHGVTPVSEDEAFNPDVHNAIQNVESAEVESGQIVATLQKGYRYKSRTLREAMVTIAS